MKKILLPLLALPLICVFIVGCEWTSGGGVTAWHALSAPVDFSGDYKSPDGGVLVRKFGSGSASTTNNTTNTVSGEILDTADGAKTAFSGTVANAPLVSGTLTIVVGGYRFTDPGSSAAGTVALTVTPADGSSGTINLNTGFWALSFPSPIANGMQIIASYQYLASVVINNQGNHGNPIYSIVLYQQGNTIQLIDSCNGRYDGTIGNVATNASPLVAQFDARGSSQGYNVQIVGTLQGSYNGSTLSSRTMKATFIEEGGMEGDINGAAQ